MRAAIARLLPDAELHEAQDASGLYAMVDAAPDADLLLLDLNMPDVQGFPHWRACARNTRSFRR